MVLQFAICRGLWTCEQLDLRGQPNVVSDQSSVAAAILQQHGSPVDATIAALVCTGVVNPQSMGLGGGVIFTIYNATTGKVEVINARETVPANYIPDLLDQCERAQPLGTGAQWIAVPGELRGYAEAHRRHGRLPWARLFWPTVSLLRGDYRMPSILSQFLQNDFLRPSLYKTSLRQLFFNGTEPLRAQDPFPWPALAATLETVATEGAEAFYTGTLGQTLLEDIANQGSRLTPQDLASFQPEVVDALEMPLGDYTLYSPPPPAGGAILSLILNVLKESCPTGSSGPGCRFGPPSFSGSAPPRTPKMGLWKRVKTLCPRAGLWRSPRWGFTEGSEVVHPASPAPQVGSEGGERPGQRTLKFAGGQRWRLWDPRSHLDIQNASQDLLGEALAQHIRQQIDTRGDHQLSHYSLARAWDHKTGTSHVSVLGEDGSAVAATSTINTPFGAMLYSPRTGVLLNNELLDLCWRRPPGSEVTPQPGEPEGPTGEKGEGGQPLGQPQCAPR
ncbi:hypothetical protein GH733_018297 [Mirounga leonina]|nr:hypothetical protein GH733_018297 [Mirounga leonina]